MRHPFAKAGLYNPIQLCFYNGEWIPSYFYMNQNVVVHIL